MGKLKIAFVVPSFPVTTETFIVNQIIDLLDRGHEVLIFAFQRNTEALIHEKILTYNLLNRTIYYNDNGVSKISRIKDFVKFLKSNRRDIAYIKFIQQFNVRKYKRKAFNLRNFTKYKWILDYAPFDIIHTHFGIKADYIAEMRALGYFASTGFITSFHGYDIKPDLLEVYKRTYKNLFEQVDLITVNTEYTKSLLLNLTTLEKLRVLPVGLNTSYFRKTTNRKIDGFNLLFIGRLVKFKGPDLAVEILKLLNDKGYKDIRLRIIGEGDLHERIKELITNYNLEKNVEITGEISQEKIVELMQLFDVFILPGIHDQTGRAENQGLVIQEAQAMKLPVVVSSAGGSKYGLLDGETGFVVKEAFLEGFVEKIEYLYHNETARKKMGEKGRAFIVENYDSSILGDQLEQWYMELKKLH